MRASSDFWKRHLPFERGDKSSLMRRVLVLSSLLAMAFAGCLEAPGLSEATVLEPPETPSAGLPPSMFEATLGPGGEALAYRVDLTEEDWEKEDDGSYQVWLVAEFEGVGDETVALMSLHEVEGDGLEWRGLGSGDRVGFGFRADAPETREFFVALASDAKEGAAKVRFQKTGDWESPFPDDLGVAAPVASGLGTRVSLYFDFGLNDFLFPRYEHDVLVKDDRLPYMDVGSLEVGADHPLDRPLLRLSTAFVAGTANVGSFSFACTADDDTQGADQNRLSVPLLPLFNHAVCMGDAEESARSYLGLEGLVGTRPLVFFEAVSLPLDVAGLGYHVEDSLSAASSSPVLGGTVGTFAVATEGVLVRME